MPNLFGLLSQDPETPLNRAKQGFYLNFGSFAQNQVGKVGKSFSTFQKLMIKAMILVPDHLKFLSQDPPTLLNRAKRGFYPYIGSIPQNQVGSVGKF